MTAADLATTADVAAVLSELHALRAELAAMAARLPSTWLSLREASERLGVDPRTLQAMASRGEIVTRRCGRRIVVDAASLAATDPDAVARLAREARGS